MYGLLVSDMGWGQHLWGAGFGWMWLVMVTFWVVVIALVVWLVVRTGRDHQTDHSSRAREILAERFARGEIDTEEYEERLTKLR